VNNELCPCVFIKKTSSRFAIVAIYVDLTDTPEEIKETAKHLKLDLRCMIMREHIYVSA
jgi:hypothetical protein